MSIRTSYRNEEAPQQERKRRDPYEGISSLAGSNARSKYISEASGTLYGNLPKGRVVGSGIGSLSDRTSYADNLYNGQLGDKLKDQESYNRRVVDEVLNPSIIAFLQEGFGIDPISLPSDILYDISAGRITRRPVKFTIVPKVWNRDLRAVMSAPEITGYTYFRFSFPTDDENRYTALDEAHKPVVQTFPIHSDDVRPVRKTNPFRSVFFDNSELTFLEGIGILSDSLFGTGWGKLPSERKREIRSCIDDASVRFYDGRDGIPFAVQGRFKVSAPLGDGSSMYVYVSANGDARITKNNGSLSAEFVSYERADGPERSIVSVDDAMNSGCVELELYEKDPSGSYIRDDNGARIPNLAARELSRYGIALRPVRGVEHDYRDGHVVSRGWYQVSAVGGGSACMPLRVIHDVPSLREPRFSVDEGGNVGLLQKRHLLPFAEDRDSVLGASASGSSADGWAEGFIGSNSYTEGLGGFLTNASWPVKDGLPIPYVAYAIADVREGGFPYFFSPTDSSSVRNHFKQEWCRVNGFDLVSDGMPTGVDWQAALFDEIYKDNAEAFAKPERRDDFEYGWDRLGESKIDRVSFIYDEQSGDAILSGWIKGIPGIKDDGIYKEFRHKATADEISFIGVCSDGFPKPVVEDAFLRCLKGDPDAGSLVYNLRFNRDIRVGGDAIADMLSLSRRLRSEIIKSRQDGKELYSLESGSDIVKRSGSIKKHI